MRLKQDISKRPRQRRLSTLTVMGYWDTLPSMPTSRPVRLRSRAPLQWVRILPFISVATVVVAWEAAARTGILTPLLFPPPSLVARELAARLASNEIPIQAAVTARRIAVGFGIGAAAGLPAGLLAARFSILRALLDPWAEVLYALPKVALLPFAFLVLGTVDAMNAALVGLDVAITFYMITLGAARRVPPSLREAVVNLGAGPFQVFVEVDLPAMAPTLLVAAQLAILHALRLTIVLEMLFAMSGVGHRLWLSGQTFEWGAYYAYLTVLGFTSLLATWLLRRLQGRLYAFNEPALP